MSASRTITFSYGSNGLVNEVTDPDTQHTMYGYDSSGDLTSVTDPMSRVTSFTYNTTSHLLLTMTLPNGQSGGPDAGDDYVNTYYSGGQIHTQTDPADLETTYAYTGDNFSDAGGTTTITDPHGNVEQQSYTDGEMLSVTKGYGTAAAETTYYTYDTNTFGATSISDPNGNVTTNTYDTLGNLLTSTDALGNTTTYTYNSLNEPLTVTSPRGIVTTYTYDSGGNVLTKVVTGVGGSPTRTTTYAYGDGHAGDLTSVTDPDGHVTDYTYDSQGDVTTTTTNPQSSTTSSTTNADHFTYTGTTSISAVGSLHTASGTALTTLSVSPATAGDMLAVSVLNTSTSVTVSSLSGGGVTTWTKAIRFDGSVGTDEEIWYGKVATTGTSTITATWSGSIVRGHHRVHGKEFSASTGSGTIWAVDRTGTLNNASSTTLDLPEPQPVRIGRAVLRLRG